MKRQIRVGVFESNSSSTHTLTICSEAQFEAWKNGELLYNDWLEEFVQTEPLSDSDKEKAKNNYNAKKGTFWKDWESLNDETKEKWYLKYAKENILKKENVLTYDEWRNNDYLETFVDRYTTEGGEKIVVFGKYGYDG